MVIKAFILSALALSATILTARAQGAAPASAPSKLPVYGEAGLGFGQTLLFGNTKAQLRKAYGGAFGPGTANNLMMGFFVAPEGWRGLGLGSRIKGTFGSSVTGDFGDSYIFNYYNLALAAKYYPLSRQYNRGFYGRGSFGFGQLTTKRVSETTRTYAHQYAIGTSLMGGLGYTLPLKRVSVSLEAEFESATRNGTISGEADGQEFRSGQLGANLYVTF